MHKIPLPMEEITIVSGLPRSGTSLLMQMLLAGGLRILCDDRRALDESNPRGYFEYEPVKHLARGAAWLPEARGAAVKIVAPLIPLLPTDGGYFYRVLMMERPLEEIAASQRTMLARLGKPEMTVDVPRLAGLLVGQMETAVRWLAGRPETCIRMNVSHRRLITEPAAEILGVCNFLGQALDQESMAACVRPELWRERKN